MKIRQVGTELLHADGQTWKSYLSLFAILQKLPEENQTFIQFPVVFARSYVTSHDIVSWKLYCAEGWVGDIC